MDISQREGKYPLPANASKIMGVEFSGTVAEVGKAVTQWKQHDEVIGLVTGVHMLLDFPVSYSTPCCLGRTPGRVC